MHVVCGERGGEEGGKRMRIGAVWVTVKAGKGSGFGLLTCEMSINGS